MVTQSGEKFSMPFSMRVSLPVLVAAFATTLQYQPADLVLRNGKDTTLGAVRAAYLVDRPERQGHQSPRHARHSRLPRKPRHCTGVCAFRMRIRIMIRVTDDPFAADLDRYKIIGAGGNFFTARPGSQLASTSARPSANGTRSASTCASSRKSAAKWAAWW